MIIIGFCGLPGSGKSTAIDAIKDLGFVITMGDVIRDEAKLRNVEPSSDNLGNIAKILREEEGQNIIAKKCIDLIVDLNKRIIFIDGIRSPIELQEFKEKWKFPLIAVVIDENLRVKRLLKRYRSDDTENLAKLKERDVREIGFGLTNVIEMADYKISNDTTMKELRKKIRKLVIEVIQNY